MTTTTIATIAYAKMKTKSLDQFDALIFDVYGTLVDWESGIYTALTLLLKRANTPFSRKEALQAYFAVEKDLQVQNPTLPYNELLAAVHKALASRLETTSTPKEDEAFGKSIVYWPVFPDSPQALATLRKYYKLIVLSNVDSHSFNTFTRPLLESAGGTFDMVLTAQDLGAYKPDPENFKAALKAIQDKLGVPKEKVLVAANSLYHDHAPANALGINTAWMDRANATIGIDSDATYDFRFSTLGDMAIDREALKKDD